jgi:hypothetical protein
MSREERVSKDLMTNPLVLQIPGPSKPLYIGTDASKLGMGFALLQKGSDGFSYPVAHHSLSILAAERKYHV